MSTGIQFELRKRERKRNEIWSVQYNIHTGQIIGIEPGASTATDRLTLSFAKVRPILEGTRNQGNFRVGFNEAIGALDLIDVRAPKPIATKKKQRSSHGWLTIGEYQGDIDSDLRALLFNENGILRVEASRMWASGAKEALSRENTTETIPLFITDIEDPHQLLGFSEIKLNDIIERGFWETRLWAFIDHQIVTRILYQGQKIRINLPAVAQSLFFTRLSQYSEFTGIIDDQTVMSHIGPGKHVSLFVKDGTLWAQSHYQPGGAIDQLKGHLQIAVVNGTDLESFVSWAWLPALLLRQSQPFEVLPDWSHQQPPSALYKANNIDIGVLP